MQSLNYQPLQIRKKTHFVLLLLCICATLICVRPFAQAVDLQKGQRAKQDQAAIEKLLNRLDSQQVSSDPIFLKGSYPSYIHHRRHYKQKHPDITIFYNILIDMTLQGIHSALPSRQQAKIDTLLERSARIYPRFYNKQRGSYNFWLRDSSYRFPYSWWIPIIKKDGAVPDDMDDTVLSRMVGAHLNRDSLIALHQTLQAFTRKPGQKLKTAPKDYRNFYTYSTWFGEKFPVVLDVAVLTNILSFVTHYDLPWTGADSAALSLIVQSIKSRDFINSPLKISPYYGKTAILLYHYSRLMQQKDIPALNSLRPALIKAGLDIVNNSGELMEKVIAANALIQMGAPAPNLTLPSPGTKAWKDKIEKSDYAYFIGNIPSYMARGLQQLFTSINAMMYYHYCPALNNALALQYLVQRNPE